MAEDGVFEASSKAWDDVILGSDVLVAVDFWHENCSWCTRLEPLYQRVAREYADRMKFAKLHVLRESKIANRYGVLGTPIIKFFCRGQEVYEIVGYRTLEVLRQELEKVLSIYQECLNSTTPLSGDPQSR
ncbi:MAG: thioredoxin family protein [Thermoplasmata archaeon]